MPSVCDVELVKELEVAMWQLESYVGLVHRHIPNTL